mgnify:CR=1 FL=1
MGQMILPAEGSVYVDTNIIIYSVEKIEPYWTMLQPPTHSHQPCHPGKGGSS